MRKTILATMAISMACAATAASAQRGPAEPLSRDAYAALQKQRFAEMDANGDGMVTKDEMRERLSERMGRAPRMIDAMFAGLDSDGDGKIAKAEAKAAEKARFTTLDTDHDGMLTFEERRAAMPGLGRR